MNENNVNVKNKNKGALIGVSVGAIAFLFLIGLLLFYFFIFNKPKQVFTTALDKVYALAKENSQNASRMSGNVKIKTDLHSNDANTEKILDVLNHITINMDYNMDAKMKKMHMVLDTKYKEKELLDASVDILNNNLYVYLQDVYSKYLFVPAEGIEEMFATMEKEKDYEIVLKYFKNALEKSLKEKYFKKENTILSINGENVNVINNQLILNEENLKEIKNTLSEELNKEEFIKSFANIMLISEDEVKEMLANLKNSNLEESTVLISIYTKGMQNEFMGISVTDNTTDKITILKTDKTKYTYELQIENQSFKGEIEIITSGKNQSIKMGFNMDNLTGNISLDYTYNQNISVPDIDVSNAISVENLNENDSMEIVNNLQSKEGIQELIKTISNLYAPDFSL